MSRLNDDQLSYLLRWGFLQHISGDEADMIRSAVAEIQQLRAAKAADRERVASVVTRCAANVIHQLEGVDAQTRVLAVSDLAHQVADALAVPGRGEALDE